MTILITGVAGFIGSHLAYNMLSQNFNVLGIDNLNNYYDKSLKNARLDQLIKNKNYFVFRKIDLCNKDSLNLLFDEFEPNIVINLAAQAGVRYSIKSPDTYVSSNLVGFTPTPQPSGHFTTSPPSACAIA